MRARGRMKRSRKVTLAVQKAQSPSNSRTGYMPATVRVLVLARALVRGGLAVRRDLQLVQGAGVGQRR